MLFIAEMSEVPPLPATLNKKKIFPKHLLLSFEPHITRFKRLQAQKNIQEKTGYCISYEEFLNDHQHTETNFCPPENPQTIAAVTYDENCVLFFTVDTEPNFGQIFYGFVNKKTYHRLGLK